MLFSGREPFAGAASPLVACNIFAQTVLSLRPSCAELNRVYIRCARIHMTNRLPQLDGWRGISILLVLAGHLLPIGPKRFELNAAVAAAGMAIFFTLSGFLITRFLLQRPAVLDFLSRRIFRIVPLACSVMVVSLLISEASAEKYPPHLLYYAKPSANITD